MPAGKAVPERVLVRLVGDDDDRLHALGLEQPRHLRHGEVGGLHLLPAGHGDGVVVEDLEGDVGTGGLGGPDRQRARMVEGAVADILEHVLALAERRLPQPGGTLAAHLGEAGRLAAHPGGHEVAADPGRRHRALGHPGRAVVRAAGTEPGQAHQGRRVAGQHRTPPLQLRQQRPQLEVAGPGHDPPGQGHCHLQGVELAVRLEEDAARPRPPCRSRAAAAGRCRAAPWPGSRSARASPRPR